MAKKESKRRSEERKKSIAEKKKIFFSKDNYTIIGIGLAIVIVGFFLMAGGTNTPDEWHAEEIYSFRRITLAPIVVLAGLSVVIAAIFKGPKEEEIISIASEEE